MQSKQLPMQDTDLSFSQKGSMTQHVAIELSRSESNPDGSKMEYCLHNQQSNKMSN